MKKPKSVTLLEGLKDFEKKKWRIVKAVVLDLIDVSLKVEKAKIRFIKTKNTKSLRQRLTEITQFLSSIYPTMKREDAEVIFTKETIINIKNNIKDIEKGIDGSYTALFREKKEDVKTFEKEVINRLNLIVNQKEVSIANIVREIKNEI